MSIGLEIRYGPVFFNWTIGQPGSRSCGWSCSPGRRNCPRGHDGNDLACSPTGASSLLLVAAILALARGRAQRTNDDAHLEGLISSDG
jgi:hypothetical protein